VTYDPERDGPLRSGASNPEDEYADGISQAHAARIAERILQERPEDNRVPEPSGGIGGPPQGYGKWGDLA
jgi:hypothetical protein